MDVCSGNCVCVWGCMWATPDGVRSLCLCEGGKEFRLRICRCVYVTYVRVGNRRVQKIGACVSVWEGAEISTKFFLQVCFQLSH